MDPRGVAASVAAQLRAATMPRECSGVYRLTPRGRVAMAREWAGYRATIVTKPRYGGAERHVYTGIVVGAGELRQNTQTGGVIIIADPDYTDTTVLSLAVVDSIRKAAP